MRQAGSSIKFALLFLILVILFIISICVGSMPISFTSLYEIIGTKIGISFLDSKFTNSEFYVLWSIRLPRVLLAILVGISLSLGGSAIQGLFRNPLADPTLIGISGGASVSVAIFIAFGLHLSLLHIGIPAHFALSLAAFLGAFGATYSVYRFGTVNGRTFVGNLLLAGIAINALAGAVTGFATFVSNDEALRDITFWMLGSLGGASWQNLLFVAPIILIPSFILLSYGRVLNAFALGEQEAAFLGFRVKQVKIGIIFLTAIMVGAAVSVSGVIGFLGLIAPHIARLWLGSNYKILMPSSAIIGAILLMVADLISRTVVAPKEIPVGIITAILGTPLFLSLLISQKRNALVFS